MHALLLMGQSVDKNVLAWRRLCAKVLGHRKAWLIIEPEAISAAHGVIDRASTGRKLEDWTGLGLGSLGVSLKESIIHVERKGTTEGDATEQCSVFHTEGRFKRLRTEAIIG